MRKPRLNENTMAKLETFGYTETSKHYYELKEYITPKGNRYELLKRTDKETGKTEFFPWGN